MNGISRIDELCRTLPLCTVDAPFGEEVLTYRVCNRIFALLWLTRDPASVAVKVRTDLVEMLTDRYRELSPAYHMNKRHWVELQLPSPRSEEWLMRLLRHSYAMVCEKLPKYVRVSIPELLAVCRRANEEIDQL